MADASLPEDKDQCHTKRQRDICLEESEENTRLFSEYNHRISHTVNSEQGITA